MIPPSSTFKQITLKLQHSVGITNMELQIPNLIANLLGEYDLTKYIDP